MTREEMSEVFALMLLAWPNAPMFREENLEATVSLWTLCLPEVDFPTGVMAAVRLCRTSHYPPSIAQMREEAEGVLNNLEREIGDAVLSMRHRLYCSGGCNPGRIARTVALMGGEERLWIPVDERASRFDIEGFRETYLTVCKEEALQSLPPPCEDGPKRLE